MIAMFQIVEVLAHVAVGIPSEYGLEIVVMINNNKDIGHTILLLIMIESSFLLSN